MAGFKEGDVVVRVVAGASAQTGDKLDVGTVGTICRVVNPGRSYRVRYTGMPFSMLVFQESIKKAPAGTLGPECEDGD